MTSGIGALERAMPSLAVSMPEAEKVWEAQSGSAILQVGKVHLGRKVYSLLAANKAE